MLERKHHFEVDQEISEIKPLPHTTRLLNLMMSASAHNLQCDYLDQKNIDMFEENFKSHDFNWFCALIKNSPEKLLTLQNKKMDWVYHLTFSLESTNSTLLLKFVLDQRYEIVETIVKLSEKYLHFHPDDLMDYYNIPLQNSKNYLEEKSQFPNAEKIHNILMRGIKQTEEFRIERKKIVNNLFLFPPVLTNLMTEYLDGEYQNKKIYQKKS